MYLIFGADTYGPPLHFWQGQMPFPKMKAPKGFKDRENRNGRR
jgi:hypothetical protein